jgi:hypothetical protein
MAMELADWLFGSDTFGSDSSAMTGSDSAGQDSLSVLARDTASQPSDVMLLEW